MKNTKTTPALPLDHNMEIEKLYSNQATLLYSLMVLTSTIFASLLIIV